MFLIGGISALMVAVLLFLLIVGETSDKQLYFFYSCFFLQSMVLITMFLLKVVTLSAKSASINDEMSSHRYDFVPATD